MASVALAPPTDTGLIRAPPKPLLLVAIALAGCAAAGFSVVLALTSDHVREPEVQAALIVWVILAYVLAGVIAWWRRPDSRFGPLMIAAGSAPSSRCSAGRTRSPAHDRADARLSAADPLPARLPRLSERPAGAAVRASHRRGRLRHRDRPRGRQDAARRLRADSVFELTTEPGVADVVLRVQLVTSAALAVAGIGVLVVRRRGAGRPLRRSLALLHDSFALALVMIAVLAMRHALGISGFETIQRITFFVVGLAPLAFLVGLLHARLARSAVGDLFVELRADPAPSDLRDALARALRDPSLTLAYWLPQFRSWADLDGRAMELPSNGSGRATTLIDRDGERVAALLHDPALRDEPELLDAVGAAAGIALENGRLHAELRARLRRAQGLARADRRRWSERAAAAGAEPARRRTAAAHCPVARAELARRALGRRPRSAGAARSGKARDRDVARRSSAMSRAASTRPS